MSLRSGCVASLVVILAGVLVIAGLGAGARSPRRSPAVAVASAGRLEASVIRPLPVPPGVAHPVSIPPKLARPFGPGGVLTPLRPPALRLLHARSLPFRGHVLIPNSVQGTSCPVVDSTSCSLKPCRVFAGAASP